MTEPKFLVTVHTYESSKGIEYIASNTYVWQGFFCIKHANEPEVSRFPMATIRHVVQREISA